MKRFLSLVLALCLLCSFALAESGSEWPFDFTGTVGNEATFETLTEARESAPGVIGALPGSANTRGAVYDVHPALDGFPTDTVYVYRSPDMYGGVAAARMNSTFLVYTPEVFADKDAAFAYVQGLGLSEIVDGLRGSIVLVTPSNGEAYGVADQENFYNLLTAITAFKAKGTNAEGVSVTWTDSEYYGTFKNVYVIGIGDGATFLNNYTVGVENLVGRFAGLLLIDGEMGRLNQVASLVPTYLVNADEATIEKYKAANEVDAYKVEDGKTVYFDQELPLRKVIVANEAEVDVAAAIKDAYEQIFSQTFRIQVYANGFISGGTAWSNTTGDCAPYSLNHRCVIDANGMTEGGSQVIKVVDEETFKDIQTKDGEYLNTWYEILPESVVNGTAAPGSVPLIIGFAGTNDDPLQFAEELGLIHLTEVEDVAVVSPGHEGIFETLDGTDGVEYETQPKLIAYMLEKYPALDPTRVYATGYSRGGRTTLKVVMAAPEILAAAVPMAANQFIVTEEQEQHLAETKIPVMFLTSTRDMGTLYDSANNTVAQSLLEVMDKFAGYNGTEAFGVPDGEAYPLSGFASDRELHYTLNDEYLTHAYFKEDANGVPMVGISFTEGLQHALYPSYAFIAWDYMEHFSRNLETGEITYTEDPTDF